MAGDIRVLAARIPRPPTGDRAALYLTVENAAAEPDTLRSLATDMAGIAQLHRSTVEGGIARMSAAGPVAVPAGGGVRLEPGGLHGMLVGLTGPLEVGDTVRVILTFARAGTVEVPALVVTYADLERGDTGDPGRTAGT